SRTAYSPARNTFANASSRSLMAPGALRPPARRSRLRSRRRLSAGAPRRLRRARRRRSPPRAVRRRWSARPRRRNREARAARAGRRRSPLANRGAAGRPAGRDGQGREATRARGEPCRGGKLVARFDPRTAADARRVEQRAGARRILLAPVQLEGIGGELAERHGGGRAKPVERNGERGGLGQQPRLVALAPVLHQRDVRVRPRGRFHGGTFTANPPVRAAMARECGPWRASPMAAPPPPAPVTLPAR